MGMSGDGVTHRKRLTTQSGQHQNRELKSYRRSHFSLCSGFFCPLPAGSSGILSHTVKPSNYGLSAGRYVRTQTACYCARVTGRLPRGQRTNCNYSIGTLKTKLNVQRKAVYVRVQLQLGSIR